MLAKLFNNISVPSLARAMGFSLLVLLALALLSPQHSFYFHFAGHTWAIGRIWYQAIQVVVILTSAWWFNSSINVLGFLKNDYQLIPVFTLIITAIFFVNDSLELLLIMPLVILLMLRLLSISQSVVDSYALFDVGSIIALTTLLVPETILFLPVCWLAVWAFGRLYFRALLMPLVGMVAVWFVAYAVVLWFVPVSPSTLVVGILSQVEIGLQPSGYSETWWRFLPLLAVAVPALIEMMRAYGKASVYKRQCFSFLFYFFLLFLVAGSFVPGHGHIWLWLALPLSVFVVNLLHYAKKNWLKDVVYALLALNLLLLFLR